MVNLDDLRKPTPGGWKLDHYGLTWHDLAEKYERIQPELWREFYPRRYHVPGGYASPRLVAMDLMGCVMKRHLYPEPGNAHIYQFVITCMIQARGVRLYWLAKDLAHALEQTAPPGRISWPTVPLPLEAGVLMLPEGALVHPEYGDAAYICWARMTAGHFVKPWFASGGAGTINSTFGLMVSFPKPGALLHELLDIDGHSELDLKDLGWMDGSPDSTGPELDPRTPVDDTAMKRATHLLFATFAVMTARPELLEAGRRTGKATRHGEDWWSPTLIGPRYRYQRVDHGGTHASPRLHWRRGHWREQAIGAGRKEHKTLWIEPTLISGE
jgi:hypothetical protein